ncbi:MAG: aminomethyl-transferring glycine dehydrogenase [Candidatus Cyclonatronum sp.]|uniref:aminomethyl-transferring glycine dehydrogenase n=1 Tax=Cyclonatronum sp. TaxID=3024185 RepID=UPI0025C13510|nr:aminomethyl-transferring glycine dehydrogenase [Cyclonatronum sp.]MCC5933845.1 aminomethyl-transferring glycine dehydrogenase [Balneolales bacterium]MCH8486633.1 aminomethyl-transferring glycine dehydrogenase [Cyclonatronum sp.]
MNSLFDREKFEFRHNSATESDVRHMLDAVGVSSVDELISQTIPDSIRLTKPLNLPEPLSEHAFLDSFRRIMAQNKLFKTYIGLGYYDTVTPPVIQRNILENPGWYTAYTPYQAEIAQGRLEALINFQTMVIDLTGMEIANASLLDEATAAAEAMSTMYAIRKGKRRKAERLFVADTCFPQTIELLKTRSEPIGIELHIAPLSAFDPSDESYFGIILQYPDGNGAVSDISGIISGAAANDIKVTVAADLLSLTLLKSPGEMGADIVVGSTQRFGIPLGYGGPHAAYFATKEENKRQVPGRMIGVSIDRTGKPAYRMALQTREQHIRREKATSNICTAQVLLAVMAGAYAVYHGPEGLKRIASRIHAMAKLAEKGLTALGLKQLNETYFDTLKIEVESPGFRDAVRKEAESRGVNFRYFSTAHIGISLDQKKEPEDVAAIVDIFATVLGSKAAFNFETAAEDIAVSFPASLARTSSYLTHEVFNRYHSEHEMLRYLKRLENRDLSLVHSMISLGSCTMKLNATTEMIPVSWPNVNGLHPFVPQNQALGYKQMLDELTEWLSEITGFHTVSLQPNSGAQGEYAGLMAIRAYHHANGDTHRNVAIIPSSAHGTNPASAVMAGMKVVITKCDDNGNINVDDLREKALKHKDELSALMVTYPSTHGVFESAIREICDIIHECGGQVYMDGANMNAQVGLTSPGLIGADVCHLNLHKTFCIPHGGGGPGMGPIGVAKHLAPFVAGHFTLDNPPTNTTAISAAPFGSASILVISYAYIRMMGAKGLTNATKLAILNANYIQARLAGHYDVLYTGETGRVAHEMIIELRHFKQECGIEAVDLAKRMMDYGYHAPTMSFPVAGTIMIEPTESESLAELDRFCDMMIAIRNEIRDIAEGRADAEDNPLKLAPHTSAVVTADEWNHKYTRQQAAYPLPWVGASKYWPTVTRIDDAYGDRNLVCSCPDVSTYESSATVEESAGA